MLKTLLIVNWRSTLVGVLAFLFALIPDLQKWLDQSAHVGPKEILALAILILGILTREKPSTLPAAAAPAAVPAILLALMLGSTGHAIAQEPIALTSIANRAHVTANAGAMVLTNGDDWSGASLGGILTYNLHQQFSASVGYDHGLPINNVDQALDFWRVFGSLRIHPNALVGFGYGWFGEGVDGGLVQLTVGKKIAPRVALQAMYAHVFADATVDDFEYARVFVNYHLLGGPKPKSASASEGVQ